MTISPLSPESARVHAIILKGHLKLLSKGLKNSRLSGTHILQLVSDHTNKKYKRGQYQQALADLETKYPSRRE